MARLDRLLGYLKSCGGSDLHLVGGLAPRVRVRGRLAVIPKAKALGSEELEAMLRELVDSAEWIDFERDMELDFAYALDGVGRFRGNFFQQANGVAAVFRLVPEEIRSAESLGLPEAVQRFAHLRSGLVLVTGPTGSGKSTTLAAIIDLINSSYEKHILTVEDPIEFVYPRRRALLSQREVGAHSRSFASAIRAALRQNPDVILIGELRGAEEIELAVSAAEMGLLVFGTLHTNSAAKTIDRLVDAVPEDAQEQLRTSLSETLAGIVSQVLVRSAEGGRMAALEVLVRTSGLANLIREGNTPQIVSSVQSGRAHGMQLMDDHLMALVEARRVHPRDAYLAANDKGRFEPLLQGRTG